MSTVDHNPTEAQKVYRHGRIRMTGGAAAPPLSHSKPAMSKLTEDDWVEFDCEYVDGRILRKAARIIYADGRVVPLSLSPAPDTSTQPDRQTL